MNKIGLVGGMTPESTTAYYRMLIDLAEIVAHQNVGDGDLPVQ